MNHSPTPSAPTCAVLLVALLGSLSTAPSDAAQTPSPRAEETASASTPTLQADADRFIQDTNIPAVGLAFIDYSGAEPKIELAVAGHRTSKREVRVQLDDLWHIGSMTKSFTATLVAKLAAQTGDLSLDTPLEAVWPAARGTTYGPVPIKAFLAHRAGVIANPPMTTFALRTSTDPIREQRVHVSKVIFEEDAHAEPLTTFLYSNAGYILAGTALEHRFDASWEELMQEHVFGPLGLKSAGFGPPGSPEEIDQPRGHMGSSNDKLTPALPGIYGDNPAFLGPAGTMHINLAELADYVALHLAAELDHVAESSYLPKATLRQLHEPLEGQPYALGWLRLLMDEADDASVETIWHNGSNTMWLSWMTLVPEWKSAVIVLTNAGIFNGETVQGFSHELARGRALRSESPKG